MMGEPPKVRRLWCVVKPRPAGGTMLSITAGAPSTASMQGVLLLDGMLVGDGRSLDVPIPAGVTPLGSVTVVDKAAGVVVQAGVRRVLVPVPAELGVAAGDPLLICPAVAFAGYVFHDVAAVSATSLSIGLTGPLLAIGASYTITARLFRLG